MPNSIESIVQELFNSTSTSQNTTAPAVEVTTYHVLSVTFHGSDDIKSDGDKLAGSEYIFVRLRNEASSPVL